MFVRITKRLLVATFHDVHSPDWFVSRRLLWPGMAFEVLAEQDRYDIPGFDLFELRGLGWAALPCGAYELSGGGAPLN
jgi:hypothetical protein